MFTVKRSRLTYYYFHLFTCICLFHFNIETTIQILFVKSCWPLKGPFSVISRISGQFRLAAVTVVSSSDLAVLSRTLDSVQIFLCLVFLNSHNTLLEWSSLSVFSYLQVFSAILTQGTSLCTACEACNIIHSMSTNLQVPGTLFSSCSVVKLLDLPSEE